ncbi:MAG: CRTAC1 family protein [Planctomycetaceae bacterium]
MSADQRPNANPETENEEPLDDRIVGRALTGSILSVVVLLAIGGIIWWLNRPEPEVVVESIDQSALPERRVLPELEVPEIPFADITQKAGIDFVHENGADGEKLLPETMGGGTAFFDFDSDGDADLLCVNSTVWDWARQKPQEPPTSALYENDGTGRFTNITAGSGFDVPLFGNGVACGDFDNDGLVDVYLTAVGPNRLMKNIGNGRFTDVTSRMNAAAGNTWSTAAGWFDMENDGDLDLFVCNYVQWSRETDLSMAFTLDGNLRAYGRPTDFTGVYPVLLRNDGDRFTDVSREAGIQTQSPDNGTPLAKSLGLTFFDANGDQRLDILVANDTVQNLLYLSQPDGTFSESGASAGIAFDNAGGARGAMGVDSGCFRNSSAIGVAIGNFANEMTALYVCQNPGEPFPVFRDEAVSNGIGPVTRVELTFGILFVDVDLDGRQDIFASNGHLEEDISKVQSSQQYEQPPQLLWNCGPDYENEFIVVNPEKTGTEFSARMVGRSATMADIDGDGDPDLFVTSSGGRPRLLRNDQKSGNHWLRFRLQGKTCNRDAIGATVRVTLPDDSVICRTVMPTRSYLAQVELPLLFGLGKHESITGAEVIWPGGERLNVPVDRVDQEIVVEQQ